MATLDIYSQRNQPTPDIFSYASLSEKLKNQIITIWKNFFAQFPDDFRERIWKALHSMIAEEHGKKTLLENDLINRWYDSFRVEYYFDHNNNIEECLDVIEIVFRGMKRGLEIFKDHGYLQLQYTPDEAIDDLNRRFLQNEVGYELQDGKIIRVDNKLLHGQIIKPAFEFLSTETFRNANDEFLSAHGHFRHGRNKECLADCLKAFETTMKIICHENSWHFDSTAPAKKLIEICLANNLIPKYLQTHFASLRSGLESGIPSLRNKLGGHGQGPQKIVVPNHYASYMLNLAGTTIHFLISCQKEIKNFK
jgi:hypothetical protein